MKKLLVIIVFFIPSLGFGQTANLSGVVTYFFNDNFGNKPDIGADVYIIDSSLATFIDIKSYDSLMKGKYFVSIYDRLIILKISCDGLIDEYKLHAKKNKEKIDSLKQVSDSISLQVNKTSDSALLYGCYTGRYRATYLDTKIFEMKMDIERLKDNFIVTNVDGNGSYSANIPLGTYYVYMQSKNRKGLGSSEIGGMIYLKKITVKNTISKTISHNFDIDD
ncbi:hypothetical protein [Ferruginibacter albus]|uniref:hypothetical protein n=1 Tax=Ferruginibacter albus TaxID=2875540 RepID=UPI001CC53085|nr:hypothetical protein [Ferruginibacter albus]UAY51286.1 hypothetical protein K9M53_11875 [Ferruginibacter albus]